MIFNFKILFLSSVFYSFAFGSELTNPSIVFPDGAGDIEAGISSRNSRTSTLEAEHGGSNKSEDSVEIAERTKIRLADVREVHQIFSNDYKDNVKDLVRMRWIFRKAAGLTECLGNACLHVGAGLSTLSTVMCLIDAEEISNVISFSGTTCIVAYVAFLGIARCCAREEKERDLLLKNLSKKVNFDFASIQHTVVDGADNLEDLDPNNPLGGLSRL